jgi:hypothetical protein
MLAGDKLSSLLYLFVNDYEKMFIILTLSVNARYKLMFVTRLISKLECFVYSNVSRVTSEPIRVEHLLVFSAKKVKCLPRKNTGLFVGSVSNKEKKRFVRVTS